MEFKGTPAPWVRYVSSIPSIDDPITHSIYHGTKRVALCYDLFEKDKSKNVTLEEAEANANLIAAAPELLKALQELLKAIDMREDFYYDVSDAEEAIKQALNNG